MLIDNYLFAPSVHCSYYALYQKLKYKYVQKKGISYEDLDVEISQDEHRGSHRYIMDEYCNFVVDKRERQILRRDIKDLKNLRVDSDYANMQIDISISNNALNKSKKLLREIDKI